MRRKIVFEQRAPTKHVKPLDSGRSENLRENNKPFAELLSDHSIKSKKKPDEIHAVSIRGHIVNEHLISGILVFGGGIPRYDLELLAYYRSLGGWQYNARWVVKKIYERLEWSDDQIRMGIDPTFAMFDAPPIYKKLLVKTLLYIEQLGLAKVDWKRVEKSLPDARDVTLNLVRDCVESGYPGFEMVRKRKRIMNNANVASTTL